MPNVRGQEMIPIRLIFLFDEQRDIPNSVPFPIKVPKELLRIFFPTRGLHMGVRTNFVREESLGLQCLTTISVISVVEDVSTCLDTLTSESL